MGFGSQNQAYIDSISGNYGTTSGYYGHGPVQSYTRPLSTKKLLELQQLYSNPTQGKAMIDPFGKILGYENEGTLIHQRAQDKLYAQLAGATAQQLLGPGPKGNRPNLSFLSPDQIDRLAALKGRLFGQSGQGVGTAPTLPSPSSMIAGGITSVPDAGGIASSIDPKTAALVGGGVLLLVLLFR